MIGISKLLTTTVPTYDYLCRSCGNITEVVHSMQEQGPTTCEICGGQLRRVLHPTGIIFKGSGFYKTDSRSSSSASVASGSRSTATTGDGDGSAAGKAKDAGSSGDAAKGKPTKDAPAPKD